MAAHRYLRAQVCQPQALTESAEKFSRDKAAATMTTSYGLSYSPHYLRQSRSPTKSG